MTKYSVKLNSVIRASLGDIRSDFVENAFLRFLYVKDVLQSEKISSQIRLLLLKEIFSIFDEIQAIHDVRDNFAEPKALDGIFELVIFIRNVLLHFPIFDTWDHINISPEVGSEMMPNRKGGQIAKYLIDNLGKNNISFDVEFSGGKANTSINLSAIKPNPDKTYLKDIISEDSVITLIIEIVQHLYTATKQQP